MSRRQRLRRGIDLPRLYREAPLNSIWEGSGNVICLDVLRAMGSEPGAVEAFVDEVAEAEGADRNLDAAIDRLRRDWPRRPSPKPEPSAGRTIGDDHPRLAAGPIRRLPGGRRLLRHPAHRRPGATFGTLPPGIDHAAIARAAIPSLL